MARWEVYTWMETAKKKYFVKFTVVVAFLFAILLFGIWSVKISIITCCMIIAAILMVLALCCYLDTPQDVAGIGCYDDLRETLHESRVLL